MSITIINRKASSTIKVEGASLSYTPGAGDVELIPDENENLRKKKKSVKKKAIKKTVKRSAPKKAVKKKAVKKVVKKVVAKKKAATKRSLKYKTPQSLQGRRSHDNGNNFEREVVKFFSYLHAVRVGGMNDNALRKSFDVYMSDCQAVPVDGLNPTVVIECKLRKKFLISEAVKFLKKLEARFVGKDVLPLLCWKIGKQKGFFICYFNTHATVKTFTIVPSSAVYRGENMCVYDFVSTSSLLVPKPKGTK